jgi:hypothetical protein
MTTDQDLRAKVVWIRKVEKSDPDPFRELTATLRALVAQMETDRTTEQMETDRTTEKE